MSSCSFTIRVVLNGGEPHHYRTLHDRMQAYGAVSHIICSAGVLYDLPEGEYNLIRPMPLTQVLDEVATIADAVISGSYVLVTEGDRAWQLPKAADAA